MSNNKFILNADDFGLTQDINRAIMEGYNTGVLMSTSLCANGEAFDSAINEIMPECPNLCVGVHLNIIEGKSLTPASLIPDLVDKNGNFNNGYIQLLIKSFKKSFIEQVEIEFRAQIEKIISHGKVAHIDSHVHTHGIPNIFELTCKLAKEYEIPFVRTQFEKPYLTNHFSKHLNLNYPINQIKVMLLNSFSLKNRKTIEKYGLKTNNYLVGVSYTGMMDNNTVEDGLKILKDKNNLLIEALFHPYPSHISEYQLSKNTDMKFNIENMGFNFTTYKDYEDKQHEKV